MSFTRVGGLTFVPNHKPKKGCCGRNCPSLAPVGPCGCNGGGPPGGPPFGCLGPGVDSESLVSEEEEEEELDDESVSEDEEDVSDKLLRGGAPPVVVVHVDVVVQCTCLLYMLFSCCT